MSDLRTNVDDLALTQCALLGVTGVSPMAARDIMGRIRACDVEGVAEAIRGSKEMASQLISRHSHADAGIAERKVLRNADTRKLKHELLSTFSEEATSNLAKNCLLFRSASLNRDIILNRLKLCAAGKEIIEDLNGTARLADLKGILSGLSLTPPSALGGASKRSDTIAFFASRNKVVQAVEEIMSKFADVRSLSSFFGDVDVAALRGVIDALQQVEGLGIQDATATISDAEVVINEQLKKGNMTRERALGILEDQIAEVVSSLRMNLEEEEELRRASMETLSLPFEFERVTVMRVIDSWKKRQEEELSLRIREVESALTRHLELVERVTDRVVLLDQVLAIASVMEKYGLTPPSLAREGIGFINGRSFLLAQEQVEGRIMSVQPVSYSLGRVETFKVARARNAVILTGANSGGKTTLLTTLATVHTLTLLGLPVPCEKAEVTPVPIYLFRKRATRRIGSLEQAMRSLIPVFADRKRKLVLIDELEALTEPGAAGRIIAAMVNKAATGSSFFLLVTHLANEILPNVKFPVRVDGIEASGLDERGELLVDRQPRFDHVGSSTPKLIIMKLSRTSKKRGVKELYEEMLASLEGESGRGLQAPLVLPWMTGGKDAEAS